MGKAAEAASAARDFTLARLAAARGALASAGSALDEALVMFVQTADDPKGKKRGELLEAIDESIGVAAHAVQAAQSTWEECDPTEGEPELDDEDDDDEDDE